MNKCIVICGFPGIGKSFLSENLVGLKIEDSDSSLFDKRAFPSNYLEHIQRNLHDCDIQLVSTHSEVLKELRDRNIPFILVKPERDNREVYVARYLKRGSPQGFIDNMINNWNKYHDDMESIVPIEQQVVLFDDQFLIDRLPEVIASYSKLTGNTIEAIGHITPLEDGVPHPLDEVMDRKFSEPESDDYRFFSRISNTGKGCVMLGLQPVKPNDWNKVTGRFQEGDLYKENSDIPNEYGVEWEPHCSVVYGVDLVKYHEDEVVSYLQDKAQFFKDVKLNVFLTNLFENEDKPYDVVKYQVHDETGLLSVFNKDLSSKYDIVSPYGDYEPHVTQAYVKKGLGKNYSKDVIPIQLEVIYIIYSIDDFKYYIDRYGKITKLPRNPEL